MAFGEPDGSGTQTLMLCFEDWNSLGTSRYVTANRQVVTCPSCPAPRESRRINDTAGSPRIEVDLDQLRLDLLVTPATRGG